MERGLVLIQVLDERCDAAFVEEILFLAGAFVRDRDLEAPVQERKLAEPLRQDVVAVLPVLEDLEVGLEGDLGARRGRRAGHGERRLRVTAFVALLEHLAVLLDLEVEPFREGVHHGHADAVKPPGDLVHIAVELAACMEHGQGHLGRGPLLDAVHLRGDAPAVVDHRDAVVHVDDHVDVLAESGHGLIHAVVHDLVDEVMKPDAPGAADIHGRPLAHGLKTFEHLYAVCSIFHPLLAKRGICPYRINPSLQEQIPNNFRKNSNKLRSSNHKLPTSLGLGHGYSEACRRCGAGTRNVPYTRMGMTTHL